MAGNSHVTEALSEWLDSVQFDQLPLRVQSKAIDVIYDSVGGMAACSILPEVKTIVAMLQKFGGRSECSIIGNKGRAPVVSAVMANGAMAHGDEVDPVHLTTSGGHVAAGPVPTALTVGQWVNASGKDVVRAIVLGYEVGGRLMNIFYRERDYIKRRFYHTAVVGTISSAVTASLLLGLDRRSLQVAIGLATYQASGPDNMRRDPGHMGKTFQVAAANRNGVTAALLAREGCSVPLDILEGSCGLFDAFLGTPQVAPEIVNGLGLHYAITEVMHKRYPVGSPNQTYLQGLFRILREHRIQPDDIREIQIQLPNRSIHTIPSTRHASISGVAVCAIAAVHGKLDFYQLHDHASPTSPSVNNMQERVEFVGREDWESMEQGRHAIITLSTMAGQTFQEDVWFQPMTQQELDEKFETLLVPQFGKERTQRLEGMLKTLASAKTIQPLMKELEA